MASVVTITLNAAYDLVRRLNRIQLGEVNTVETLGLFPAGKGINVAKVLKDLGVDVAVGGFWARIIQLISSKCLISTVWKINSTVWMAKHVSM